MNKYVALLRGINVGGQKKISMQDLKQLLNSLPIENIITYIQSGNIVFDAGGHEEPQLAALIRDAIRGAYGFEVPVIIRSINALRSCLDEHPYPEEMDIDPDNLYYTFLAGVPAKKNLEQLSLINYEPEKYCIKNREVYIYCPGGYGHTKLNNAFFERKLGVEATTRNLKTLKQLIKLGTEV